VIDTEREFVALHKDGYVLPIMVRCMAACMQTSGLSAD
jgi:hypothetical protein